MASYFVVCLMPLLCHNATAKLDSAAILPHGDFAIDPTLLPALTPEREAADAIAKGAASVGKWFGETVNPDLIFLSTPHGIELTNDFGLYLGSKASGTATIGGDLHNASHPSYNVRLPSILLAPELSQTLVNETSKNRLNVSGILVSADDSEDEPLHWGEVIPLLLIPRRNRSSYASAAIAQNKQRQHVILSHPLRRYTEAAAELVPELLHLGRWLGKWMEQLPRHVGVVISADLSHTHQADGPYGYSNTSALFDAAVNRWAQDPCSHDGQNSLLVEARDLQVDAKSCGYTGLVMLHGMLCSCCTVTEWVSHVAVNRNATYYGMMAAQFQRETSPSRPE